MTITQLEYILAVDKYRHFGQAAKACNVTQPTLSMQLQKAEEEFETILFDRSRNPILPTPEGEKIILQARTVIKEYRRLFSVLDESKDEVKGHFRLGVIPTLAPYLIPLFVGKFSEEYPEVDLMIEEFKTEEIIDLLKKDELDAGILVTPLEGESFIERVLFQESFHIFADKSNPLLKKAKVTDKDLDLNDVWLLNEGHCLRNQVLNLCSVKRKAVSKRQNLHFESGNLETLKNMVVNYQGFTLLPYLAASNLSGELKNQVRDFQGVIPTREVSLVHNRLFLKEKIINALEAKIIESLPDELQSLKKKKFNVISIESP